VMQWSGSACIGPLSSDRCAFQWWWWCLPPSAHHLCFFGWCLLIGFSQIYYLSKRQTSEIFGCSCSLQPFRLHLRASSFQFGKLDLAGLPAVRWECHGRQCKRHVGTDCHRGCRTNPAAKGASVGVRVGRPRQRNYQLACRPTYMP
jgi:hypothetical protein